jgi:hypothetical protein
LHDGPFFSLALVIPSRLKIEGAILAADQRRSPNMIDERMKRLGRFRTDTRKSPSNHFVPIISLLTGLGRINVAGLRSKLVGRYGQVMPLNKNRKQIQK